MRILRGPEGARAMLAAFRSNEVAGACVDAIIGSGIIPVALEFMDRPAIHACEAFAHAGYPLDAEAMLIIEVEGSVAEQDDLLGRIKAICSRLRPDQPEVSQSAGGNPPPSGRAARARSARSGGSARTISAWTAPSRPAGSAEVLRRIGEMSAAYGLKVANIFHAGDGNLHPLIMFDANDPDSFERAEKFGADILKPVRRGRRLPDRRARRRRREARPDAGAVHRRSSWSSSGGSSPRSIRAGCSTRARCSRCKPCRGRSGGMNELAPADEAGDRRGDPGRARQRASRCWCAATAASSACCARCRRRARCHHAESVRHHALRAAGTDHLGPRRHAARRGRGGSWPRRASISSPSRPIFPPCSEHDRRADARRRGRHQPVRAAPGRLGRDARPRDGRARGERARRDDPLRRPGAEERHRPRPLQAADRQPRHAGGA